MKKRLFPNFNQQFFYIFLMPFLKNLWAYGLNQKFIKFTNAIAVDRKKTQSFMTEKCLTLFSRIF